MRLRFETRFWIKIKYANHVQKSASRVNTFPFIHRY